MLGLFLVSTAMAGDLTCGDSPEFILQGEVQDVYFLTDTQTRVELKVVDALKGEVPELVDYYLTLGVRQSETADGRPSFRVTTFSGSPAFLPARGDNVLVSLSRYAPMADGLFQFDPQYGSVYPTPAGKEPWQGERAWSPAGFVISAACDGDMRFSRNPEGALTWSEYVETVRNCVAAEKRASACPSNAGSYGVQDWKSVQREMDINEAQIQKSRLTQELRRGGEK